MTCPKKQDQPTSEPTVLVPIMLFIFSGFYVVVTVHNILASARVASPIIGTGILIYLAVKSTICYFEELHQYRQSCLNRALISGGDD